MEQTYSPHLSACSFEVTLLMTWTNGRISSLKAKKKRTCSEDVYSSETFGLEAPQVLNTLGLSLLILPSPNNNTYTQTLWELKEKNWVDVYRNVYNKFISTHKWHWHDTHSSACRYLSLTSKTLTGLLLITAGQNWLKLSLKIRVIPLADGNVICSDGWMNEPATSHVWFYYDITIYFQTTQYLNYHIQSLKVVVYDY